LTTSIADHLGVDENSVTLSIDPENGEVTYSVTTNDFAEGATILDQLQDPAMAHDVTSGSGIIVSEITSDDNILVEVNVMVNVDEIEVPLQQAENIIDALLGDEYTSITEVKYITFAPSAIPTVTPSDAPSSAIPASMPSITGSVVFIDMQQLVTATLTDEDVSELVATVENTFGLFPDNVQAEIQYDIIGTIEIVADEEVSNEELASTLQDSIAASLNVHPSDVDINIDADGVVTYTISSATAEEASALQELLQDVSTNQAILDEASHTIPTISTIVVNPSFGVYADVSLIVDATNTDDIDMSIDEFRNLLDDQWSLDRKSVFITSTPSALPTSMPYLN
jgi:hypothetical protein